MDHPVDLEQRLRRTLPAARLAAQTLPGLPDLRLWLLDPDYPRTPVSSSDMQAIWQEPAYWIFCWASGLPWPGICWRIRRSCVASGCWISGPDPAWWAWRRRGRGRRRLSPATLTPWPWRPVAPMRR